MEYYNICKTEESEDFVVYTGVCDCKTCTKTIVIEVQKDCVPSQITTTLYYKASLSGWWHFTFWDRVKMACQVVLGQSVELETDYIFSEKGLRDYLTALQTGLEFIEDGRK